MRTTRFAALALLVLAGTAGAQDAPALEEAAARVRECWARADVAGADEVLAGRSDLRTHDRAQGLVTIDVTFQAREAWGVSLTITRRPGVEGALGIAFPPGTLASPKRAPRTRSDGDDDPDSQELVLLRAPVVVLGERQASASIWVPAVCGNHALSGPSAGQGHFLTYVKPGSAVDRIAARLCAGPTPPDEAQGMVWIARNDVSREQAQVGDEAAVARVFEEAGVDTSTLRWFAGRAPSRPLR